MHDAGLTLSVLDMATDSSEDGDGKGGGIEDFDLSFLNLAAGGGGGGGGTGAAAVATSFRPHQEDARQEDVAEQKAVGRGGGGGGGGNARNSGDGGDGDGEDVGDNGDGADEDAEGGGAWGAEVDEEATDVRRAWLITQRECTSLWRPKPFRATSYAKSACFRRSFRSAIRRGKTTANDAQVRVFAAVYDWRDRVARMEDESPEYVCDSRLIAAVARSRRPPRSYEDLVKMESNLPPLLSRPIMAVALKGAVADAVVGAAADAVVGAVVGAMVGTTAGKAAGKDIVDQTVQSKESVEELGGGEGKDRTNPSSTAVEPEVLWAAPPRPDVLEESCGDDEDGGGGEGACISYVESFLAAVAVAADTPDVADVCEDDLVEDTGGSAAAAAATVAVVAEAVCEGGSGGEGKG